MPFCINCGAEKNTKEEICPKCGFYYKIKSDDTSTHADSNESSEIQSDTALTPEEIPSSVHNYSTTPKQIEQSNYLSVDLSHDGNSQPANNGSRSKYPYIIGICSAIVVIILCSVYGVKEIKYNNAMELMNQKLYQSAMPVFDSLNGYKNSSEYLKECTYLSAKQLMEKGSYDTAAEYFTSLENYKDSDSLIANCYYQWGKQLYDNGKYVEAQKLFDKLGNYSDSIYLSNMCDYKRAIDLYNKNSWSSAKSIFVSLGEGFEDSDAYIALCEYRRIKDSYTPFAIEEVGEVLNNLCEYASGNDLCKEACEDSIFTFVKLLGVNYSNGYYSFKITINEKEKGTFWMTYNNFWEMWGHEYWDFDETKGKYGMFTYTKDEDKLGYVDWFEVYAFDDPASPTPSYVTIKNPNNGKEYKLKRGK